MLARRLPYRRVVSLAACLFALIPARAARAQTSVSAPQPASARVTGWPSPAHDNMVFAHVLTNELEDRTSSSGALFRWDGEGWIGSDMNRLWIKSEGDLSNGTVSDGDHEFLYDRPIPRMRYFDAQAGVRADIDSAPTRVWAAFGMEGLALFGFDFEPTFYISDGGHLAGRIEGSYDLYLTQRWVLQPQAELNFYSKDDPRRDLGSGFSDIDSGIRLHYQISRKFTPYIGWTYAGKYGDSARYTRQAGEPVDSSSFVFGLRLWY